jgi:2'-deoxynucleoside 5'-phosphate N-hydrolase
LYTPKKIYNHTLDCVEQCDVFVGECSHPSTGLGYEIALAVQKNKKILLIAHQDAKVTRMILGIPPEKAVFLRYQELKEI